MKLPKINWYNLISTYMIFSIIYGFIIMILWNFLFSNLSGFQLTALQGMGLYVMIRILFNNSNNTYVSNFYSTEPLDMDKVEEKINDLKEEYGEDEK